MKQDQISDDTIAYSRCRYGESRLVFRGPRRNLDQPYLAFVGGASTYGKFVDKPFPVLVEEAMRRPCVNLGCVNAGVDAILGDKSVMDICRNAEMTVVQATGAHLLSNRFYGVHPRRNDRFLWASTVMRAIYHEVDFSEFTFTRHMLGALLRRCPDRFETVVAELQTAWVARMRTMLTGMGENVFLVWFADQPPVDDHWSDHPGQLQADPLFVTRTMIEELRPLVRELVTITAPSATMTPQVSIPAKQPCAQITVLGEKAHQQAATALTRRLRDHLTMA